ncbi:hypothetical protein M413DRAFT_345108 [Hebeloma cylindrosporum]|uniref:Transmembrane protein n=1 Tax=Hebeloma cylindrosporum TaxID=76867 RepID=A0A0C3CPF2_HEBCY|nr:hypothetical protein M413DRAFT_345108 [Hebeloma cylindrosporum h7]
MSNGYNYADDNDPGVAYAGSWTQITKTGPYANSLHQTTQSGAGATIHFTGNLGRVFGSVPACDPSVHQEFVIVAIFLDDVSVAQVMQPCGTAARDNVMFYDSGTLSGGNQPHKLSAVNQLANCLPFQFSAFSWGVDSATAATATRIVAAPIYSIPPTTGVLSIIAIQGSSGSINRSMRGSSTISSGTSLAADSSPSSSSVQFVTVNGIVTSMVIAPAATGSGDNQGRSLSPSTGLIVGCIMGVLLFVILLILLLNFCRRRRNRLHATTQPSNADAITPFRLTESANNPSTGFPSRSRCCPTTSQILSFHTRR